MRKKQMDKEKKGINKRRKMKTWKKILLIILLILIILVAWIGYKTYKNGGGLSGFLATAVGHNEYTKKNLQEIKVLIMGVSTDIDADLTDTIMVASYNPNEQTANILSIPRDTFTGKNPKKAQASQKINALYNISKGPEKTLEAVNEITGLDIQYYVVVRTEALIKLVDAIGGVNFNVPIDMVYDDSSQDLHINLKAGEQKLDGDKAEQLLRWRHSNTDNRGGMTTYPSEYGNDDFGRMRTQRDFIVATLKQTLKPSNIFKIGQILDIVHKDVETNLELSFIKDYIPYAVELNAEEIKTATLPGTTPNLSETNNVSVFVVDEKEAKSLIDSMFNSKLNSENEDSENTVEENNKTSNKVKIELLNGSGDTEKLERAKELLKNEGYEISKTGKTTLMSKTIITNKKDTSDEDLKKIKEILETGDITTNKTSTSLVDVSIVIGKDF